MDPSIYIIYSCQSSLKKVVVVFCCCCCCIGWRVLLQAPSSRFGGGPDPVGRDPLGLVLRLPDRRQQLDTGILQLIVDQDVIKELPVLRLDLTRCIFHLLEIFILVGKN